MNAPPLPATDRTRATRAALAVTGLALTAGAVIPRLPGRLRFAASVGTAAAALALARRGGADRAELGCDPADLSRGARFGIVAAVAIAGGVGAAARHPSSRALFADARVTGATRPRAAYEVLVRIPVATALAEELVFRGALLGAWEHAVGPKTAVTVSSLAFGVWHVIPALEAHAHNPSGARLSARAEHRLSARAEHRLSAGADGRSTHVAGTVLATAVAGSAFAMLRRQSRSVVAPVIAHASINQAAYVAARWAQGGAVASAAGSP